MQYIIKSTFDDVQNFETSLESKLKDINLSKSTLFNIRLAFHEAIINVIQHTYKFSEDKEIAINIEANEEYFECTIHDFGEVVSPDRIRPKKTKDIQTSGLGVFLYSKLMDEVEFCNTEDGNLLRLKKFFKNTDFK